ncbi:MAG TPA: peroxidase family protein [Polyangiales bacterium]|nr:peroxidase family protein [Polyangiales bacterium]
MTRMPQQTWTAILAALAVLLVGAEECSSTPRPSPVDLIAPDRQIHPDYVETIDGEPSFDYRNIDGTGNHTVHFELGAANTTLRRILPNEYSDKISAMAGINRPSPREVSNVVCDQGEPVPNELGASDFVWQWGQFLDHDIDLTEGREPFEPAHIRPETGDPFFDPNRTGLSQIDFFRSRSHAGTGIDATYPRQQMNMITHYIDASHVYGSDPVRAAALRTNDGTGRLKISAGNLLPFNTDGLHNAGGNGPELFVAGDIRANEQVGLTAMHTLFVREHNRMAAEIAASDPSLSGEEIYQRARRYVAALMQGITYNEFLPALLGPNALTPYSGYKETVSPAIFNCFSTAAFRFGHSAVSGTLLRLQADGQPSPFGHLPLKDAFFRPERLITEGGIEPILRGLAAQEMSKIDVKVVDALRNFLFGDPTAGGLDLVSLNLQRGRDHGLPGYARARGARGLGYVTSFAQISSDPEVQSLLAAVYPNVDSIDLWVGGIAEDPVNGGHVGSLVFHLLKLQFESLRDGDRYWYQWDMSAAEIAEIDATTLADVIRRNTTIGAEISDDVFHVN